MMLVSRKTFICTFPPLQKTMFHLYHQISSSDFGDIVAIHIEKSGKHQITDHPAEWFDKYFKEAFDALVDGEEE